MISLVVFDFDGTFTDGNIYFNEDVIIKKYNVIDGMGIKLLKENNIKTVIITGFKATKSFQEICNHLQVDYYFENIKNKLEILNNIKDKLQINENNIAYIGDDINDYDILNSVKIKGCVFNAVDKIKHICNFISKHKGGNGAVREFCEYILTYNKKETKVVCFIPARMNSSRLYGKPLLKFGKKSMIQMLYEKVKTIEEISKIVILTDSKEIEDHVKLFNAECVVVDEYCNSGTHRILNYLKKNDNNYEYILNIQGDEPFINIENVKSCINSFMNYKDNKQIKCFCLHGEYNNNDIDDKKYVKCVVNKQNNIVYMSRRNVPTNYINLGSAFIIETDYLKNYFDSEESLLQKNEDVEWNNILDNGYTIHSTLVNDYERSVDTQADYNYLLKKYELNNKIKIIDCTVRDGGFENGWNYSYEQVKDMMINCDVANLYAFEIGYILNEEFVQEGMGPWRNIQFDLIKKIKTDTSIQAKISVMIDIWRYDFNNLPEKKYTSIDIIRLCIYPNDLLKYVDIYEKLRSLGYLISINIIAVSHIKPEHYCELETLVKSHGDFFDFLYLADSFGSLHTNTLETIIKNINKIIKGKNILLGFHGHNNGGLALSNSLRAIELGVDIIDGTYNGSGRGGGNLVLEDFILYNFFYKDYQINIKLFLEFLKNYYNNNSLKNKYLKELICGFLNVHPYRLREFNENNNNLYLVYEKLSLLNNNDKQIY